VKVLDYARREAELEAHRNPFAQVVLAHLNTIQTRNDPDARRLSKFRLVRGLYERGFAAADIRQLFRIIDWLMELPPPQKRRFWKEFHDYQEERAVPFITTPEWFGREQGMLQILEDMLDAKFGEEGTKLLPEIAALEDLDKLRALGRMIMAASSLDEVRRSCAAAVPPEQPKKRTRRTRGS
jgi:hypothetical protein